MVEESADKATETDFHEVAGISVCVCVCESTVLWLVKLQALQGHQAIVLNIDMFYYWPPYFIVVS